MKEHSNLQSIREFLKSYPFEYTDEGWKLSIISGDCSVSFIAAAKDLEIPIEIESPDGAYIAEDEADLYIDKPLSITVISKDLERLGIYWNWEKFLRNKINLINTPPGFFIFSTDSIYPSESPAGTLKHYLDINQALKIIIDCADHIDKLSSEIIRELIFLHKARIEVPVVYTEANLKEGLDGISILDSIFSDPSHKEQKRSILKEVLYNLLSNVSKDSRLQHLFCNFGEFSKRINENYQLFVSEFSFDDVRKEYEEKKRDYLSKLNDVFSSLHTKMLGIPVSLALVSLKIKLVDKMPLWPNIIIFIAITIYSNMMCCIIKNGKHTLKAIKNEYNGQMLRMKHQYIDQYKKIEDIKKDLDERYYFHKKYLNYYYVISIGVFFIGLIIFGINLPWDNIFKSIPLRILESIF